MGFFHDIIKTVSSTIIPLMDEAPDQDTNLVLGAVLQDQNIADVLLDNYAFGSLGQISRYEAYARDSYVLGVPQGYTGAFHDIDDTSAKILIEELVGESITIEISSLIPLTATLVCIPYLYHTRGMDLGTYQISIFNPAWVFEEGDAETGHGPVRIHTVTQNTEQGTFDLTYSYTYEVAFPYVIEPEITVAPTIETAYVTESISQLSILGLHNINLNEYYTIVQFIVDSTGERDWFYTETFAGRYPDLTVNYQAAMDSENYFPVIPIRRENVNLTDEAHQSTELYQTSKQLLKKIAIDIDELSTNLHEDPEVDEVDHAYVMNALNIMTSHVPSIYYLTLYFHHLYEAQVLSMYDHLEGLQDNLVLYSNIFSYQNKPTLAHHDPVAITEYGLNLVVNFRYITSRNVIGKIGEIGHAEQELGWEEIWILLIQEELFDPTDPIPGLTRVPKITFKAQTSATSYLEVAVIDLQLNNIIYHDHLDTVVDLKAVMEDPDNSQLFIPMHFGIWNSLPSKIKVSVFQNSLVFVLNSFEETVLAWYMSKGFKMIMMAVTFVLSYFTGPALGAVLKGLETVGQVVMFIVEALVLNFAIQQVVSFVVKQFGPELGAIVAIIALVASAVSAYNNGLTFNNLTISPGQLLSLSNAALKGTVDVINRRLKDLQEEVTDWVTSSQEAWDELEETISKLFPDFKISPDILLEASHATIKIPGDLSPDFFYNRTIHNAVQIPTVIASSISVYYDAMLSLPSPANA